jgi:branched-chain amino acid transport system permease protein
VRTRRALTDIGIALAALGVLSGLPFVWHSPALIDYVIRLAAYALFATSLNLLIGYGGMVSFGHGMFFGLGAYCFGLLMQRLVLPIPLAILATLAFGAVVGAAVGALCVRLRAIYFAFVTLAMQMLLYSIIIAWVSLTGGDQGLRGGIPRPVFFGINLAHQSELYEVSCVLMVIGLLLMRHILDSPFGYSLRMVRDNETRAAFLGIRVYRAKLIAFTLAAVFASLGGVVMSLYVSGAYPELAFWTTSGEGVFIIIMGGVDTFLGPSLGAVLLLLLEDVTTRVTEYKDLVLGLVILVFALGLRRGLLDFLQARLKAGRP